ncbi:MAG: hypothetical protein JSW00_10440 [Thermoplasmata archaeon]|nr:MAG: hypothetical protein JSW00_10440 [Thermoplasmata archaeon]
MHEIIDINPASAFVFALVLVFGICSLLLGLIMAVLGREKSRAMGFLQMSVGWIALFGLYLFLWNPEFLVIMIVVIIGGIVGAALMVGLMLVLLMKS